MIYNYKYLVGYFREVYGLIKEIYFVVSSKLFNVSIFLLLVVVLVVGLGEYVRFVIGVFVVDKKGTNVFWM